MVTSSKIARTGVAIIEYLIIALLVGAVAFGLTPVFQKAHRSMEMNRVQQNKTSFNSEGSTTNWFKPGGGEAGVLPGDPGDGLGPADELDFSFNCGTLDLVAEEAKCGIIPGACGILKDGCWICNPNIQMWQWETNKATCRDYWFGNVKETCSLKCVLDFKAPSNLPPFYGDGTAVGYCYICADSGSAMGYWYREKAGSNCMNFWNNPYGCFGSDTSFASPCGSCTGEPPFYGYYHEKTRNGGDSCWICEGNQWINTNVESVCMKAWVNVPSTCPNSNELISDRDYPYCGCSAPPPARGQNGITVGTDKCWICRNNTWERESDSTKCQEFWIDNKCEGYTPSLPLPCNGATTTPTSPALGAGNCWLCTNPYESYRQNPIDKDPLYPLLGKPCNMYWIDEEYPHFLNIPGEPDDLDTVCSAPFSSLGSAEPGIAQDPVSGKWGCWACNENNYKTWARIEWNGDRFVNVASPEYQACHSFWMDGVYPNSYPLPSPLEGKTYGWGNNDYGQIGDGTEVAKINGPVDIGKNLTDIAKGAYHTCGLDAAGKVWCWGVNRYGQFGNGKYGINEKSSVPVQGPTSHTFWKIAAGGNTTCAIDTLSRAWCWGDDSYWNTGSDEPSGYSFRPTPVEVHGGRKYVDITVSEKHTCAIDTVGRAWCWGYNDAGQLGNTSVTESRIPVKVEGSHVFKKISANGDPFHSAHVAQTCAIDTAGRAWCWGNNAFGQLGNNNKGVNSPVPVQVDYAGTFKDISVGREYTCAINSSDKILCWGGGVGTGNSNYYAKPTISIAGTYKSVSSANIHTCAISLTGDGYCWGWNNTGQLGDGTQSDSEAPVKVLGGPYAKIITNSSESTSALGEFTHAQPPPPPPPDPPPCNGSTSPSGTPSAGNCWLCTNPSESYRQNPIDGSPLYSLYDKPCNIYWADEDYPPFLNIPGDPDDLDTVCSASFSSLGSADPGIAQDPSSGKWGCWACNENNSKTWQRIEWDGDRFVNVASPEYQACHSFWMEGTYPNSYPLGGGGSGGGGGGSGTVEDPNLDVGSAVAWGLNVYGQLGDGTTVNRNIPVTILGEHTFKQVSAGYEHTCALDTTGKAWCWGSDFADQLGNGATNNSSVPVAVSSTLNFNQISAGYEHTCALDTTGKAWCWGRNTYGQLGNGTTKNSSVLVAVSSSRDFKQISEGDFHTCALDTTGKVWCWGYNYYGQLGNGNSGDGTDSSTPVEVSSSRNFKQISIGPYHNCALDTEGKVWCWGYNYYGQLGNGTTNNSSVPVEVSSTLNFNQISAGHNHTCALDTTGKAWCWGLNYYGQLGNGTTNNSSVPVEVSSTLNFNQISAGWNYACALDTTGKAWCWGGNSVGELGNGTTDNSSVLVEVSGSYTFSQISAGEGHVVAITRDPSGPTMPTLPSGPAYAWGENNYGQLGDNSQINRLSPVPIGKTFIDVAPGHTHTCALDEEGKAWCWGSNSDGQAGVRAPGIEGMLGSPDFGAMPLVPTTIGSVSYYTFKKIATGNFLSYHTCAIDTDDAAWCWGRNMWDALGGGSSYTSYNWYCNPVPVTGGHLFKDIVVWTQSTFALDTDGKVWSWGQGSGETPVEISGEHTFTQIAIGHNKLHGIDTAGDIWEWKNSSTLVKVDKSLASPAPITVPFVQVTGSVYHVCALDSTGKAWCWKDNRDGALGIGTIEYDVYNAPQAVLGGLTFKELTAGSTFTCGLTLAGDAYCWGSNLHGELGNNQVTGTDPVLSPTKVDGGPYKTIKAGGTFVIGIVE